MTEHSSLNTQSLLMIGPLPPPLGGATVAFFNLCQFCCNLGIKLHVINSYVGERNPIRVALEVVCNILRNIEDSDVVALHTSNRGALTLGPIIFFICRIFRKPFVLRIFGGNFDLVFADLPFLVRLLLAKTVLRSDLVLLETEGLVANFSNNRKNVRWFPNARSRNSRPYEGRFAYGMTKNLRCIFVSQVTRSKGILTAAAAINNVPRTKLDVFGPLIDVVESDFESKRVKYHGIAEPEQVPGLLSSYDVLIFPTIYHGEGYPGVLVEAMMAGLPIITTLWKSIPEMFPNDEARFISDQDSDYISDILRDFIDRPEQLIQYSERLRLRSMYFDSERLFQQFCDECEALRRGK